MTKRSAGYSMFEVLIAFAIMALVLSALLPGQAQLLSRAAVSGDRLLAHDFALSRLAQIQVTEDLTIGETSRLDGPFRALQRITSSSPEIEAGQRFDILITVEDMMGRELARVAGIKWQQP